MSRIKPYVNQVNMRSFWEVCKGCSHWFPSLICGGVGVGFIYIQKESKGPSPLILIYLMFTRKKVIKQLKKCFFFDLNKSGMSVTTVHLRYPNDTTWFGMSN